MTKLLRLADIAVKYLFRYRRRYLFLFCALGFGFGIVTLISTVKDGMSENVYYSAQGHYAGDIIALGYYPGFGSFRYLPRDTLAEIDAAVEASGIGPVRTVRRTIFGNTGMLYYNGAAMRLKYVTGVEWENEAAYFENLVWAEPPGVFGDSTILLSAPVAELLGARQGDLLTLEVSTRYGQKNTGSFTVGGIIDDRTIFGYYKVFVSLRSLNRLCLLGDDECGIVGFYLAGRNTAGRDRLILQGELEKRSRVGPVVHDRDGLAREDWIFAGEAGIFLLTIPVLLSEVADLLNAVNIITWFLYIMMLVIILMSALVTYRLVLHERRREFGTMRAIGFYGADLRFVLFLEAAGLALVSLLAGLVLARFLQWLVTFIPLAWFPSFDIFLRDGKLSALWLPETQVLNVLAVFAVLVLAAVFPVWKVSREPLPPMLNGG